MTTVLPKLPLPSCVLFGFESFAFHLAHTRLRLVGHICTNVLLSFHIP